MYHYFKSREMKQTGNFSSNLVFSIPGLITNLTTAMPAGTFYFHVSCEVGAWHTVVAFGSLILTAEFDQQLLCYSKQLRSLKVRDPVLHRLLLFCFRWNTGACFASAPSAGGRIKHKKCIKTTNLYPLKDNPQTTQLPIERNELIMLLLTNNQCIFSMCAFYITSYKYMLCSTAVPKYVSVIHSTIHINLLTLLQLLLPLLSRSGWMKGHSSFRENACRRGDRNSRLIQSKST